MACEELFLPQQTCTSLYGVMLSSRSENPGGPVHDPHPRTLRRRPTKCAKHLTSSSTPSSSNIVSRLAEAPVLPYALPELGRLVSSRALLSLAAHRTTGNDSRALDSSNYADDPNSR
ncbi:hypothetical protein TNCT_215071 [Trichonephila clavata]|uniref:Uncharacterized protein n=1 Tax=Trichonephila clavata TaxID=2740835 RepID=A0A8X6EY05_TRICU|nr:hypothetical protein TNCT_215071 [Trichonephila clavata]